MTPTKFNPPQVSLTQLTDAVTVLDTPSKIRDLLGRLTTRGSVAGFDLETVGVDPDKESPVGRGEPVCFSLAIADASLGTHSRHGTPLARRYFGWADALESFREWIESPDYFKVGDGLWSFDRHVLANVGFELRGILCDNLRLSRLLNASSQTHDLKSFMKDSLGYPTEAYRDVFRQRTCLGEEDHGEASYRRRTVEGGKLDVLVGGTASRLGAGWTTLDIRRFASQYPERIHKVYGYASLDAKGSFERYQVLRESAGAVEWRGLGSAKRWGTVQDYYRKVWSPFLNVLWGIERRGIRYDKERTQEVAARATEEVSQLLAACRYHAGDPEFNPGSGPQLTRLLYDTWGLDIPPVEGSRTALKKVRPGKRPTSEASLAWLTSNGQGSEALEAIKSWRKASRQLQFLQALPEHILPQTGRIHSILQPEAATGRLTSKKPNLQQIPKRYDPYGIRRAFVPGPGNLLVVADFFQLEMVVLSHFLIALFGDHSLAEDLATGDAHQRTATRLGLSREVAKEINYGISYGKSDMGLGLSLGIPTKKAKEYLQRYFKVYPGIQRFQTYCFEEAKRTGVVRTLVGRFRPIPEARSEVDHVQRAAARKASNTPIQGSAADIVVASMLKLESQLAATGLGYMVLQVHDELLVEVPESKAEQGLALVKESMENPFKGNLMLVPLTVTAKIANNWLEGH